MKAKKQRNEAELMIITVCNYWVMELTGKQIDQKPILVFERTVMLRINMSLD